MGESILFFVAVGFLAQVVDGALGMAYGVTSNSLLLSLGLPPASASATVHCAEVVTSGVSGLFHLKFGNVDRSIFLRLVIPGVLGAVSGAYLLSHVEGDVIKPFIAVYLLIMGARIIYGGLRKGELRHTVSTVLLLPLGLAGALLDAVGGGGWGPVVTTTIIAYGHRPARAIGSTNLAEFFVTTAAAVTFILTVDLSGHWTAVIGLLIGGVAAAPFAAFVCKKIPPRALMVAVGVLITALSIRTIYLAF